MDRDYSRDKERKLQIRKYMYILLFILWIENTQCFKELIHSGLKRVLLRIYIWIESTLKKEKGIWIYIYIWIERIYVWIESTLKKEKGILNLFKYMNRENLYMNRQRVLWRKKKELVPEIGSPVAGSRYFWSIPARGEGVCEGDAAARTPRAYVHVCTCQYTYMRCNKYIYTYYVHQNQKLYVYAYFICIFQYTYTRCN